MLVGSLMVVVAMINFNVLSYTLAMYDGMGRSNNCLS